jgi:hypothetical protein
VVAAVIGAEGCGSASAVGCCGPASAAGCCGSTSVAGYGGSVATAAYCASAATGSGSMVVAAGRGSKGPAASREPLAATVAVLAAVRDALDEGRRVGTTASVLSTLAGARGGTADATLRTRGRETLGPGRSKNTLEGKRPLTSGWKIPFSFSSGLGGRRCRRRCGRRRAPGRLHGARRHPRGARRLSC